MTFTGLPLLDGSSNLCLYTVTETPKPGYVLDTGASSPLTGLLPGTSVTVVNNQITTQIAVTKTVLGPPSPRDWVFTLSVLPVSCDISGVTNPIAVRGNGGTASFTGLRVLDESGNECIYAVAENSHSGYFFVPGASDPLTGINPANDGTPVALDITNQKGGSIGDRVWLDTDGDGVQDIGEPGLGGVTVTLHDDLGVQLASTMTDTSGLYLFADLVPEDYEVRVNEASLPVTAGDLVLAPGSTNPNGLITLTAGLERLDIDFGYVPRSGTALIGDYVWADADADGIQDPGELGIDGVTLDLLVASTGAVVDTVTTNSSGVYLFSGVAPGEYKVSLTDTGSVLAGYTATTGPQSVGAPLSSPVTVLADGAVTDVDFGYDSPSLQSISNRVWLDLDADGIHDLAEEPGIGGVTVNLLDALGNLVASSVSDAAGNVSFTGVPNGNYTVDITDTANVLDNHAPTTAPATAGQLPVTVAGAPVTGVDFGYNIPGMIGDRIWLDTDGDGVQDLGEAGALGVTVQLRDAAGVVVLATDTTTADGAYLFMNLLPGTYTVVVNDAGAVLAGFAQTGDPDGTFDNRSVTTLLALQSDLDLDFGYQDPTPVTIAGSVFEDPDEDGVEEAGEPPLPSVLVELVDPASGLVVASALTNGLGDYLFTSVLNGNYVVVVRETQPPLDGYHLTSGLDSIPVTVAGAPITDIDFGYNRDGANGLIGDYVWFDFNRDGVQNGGENGISGVTLRLYQDSDGDGVRSPGDTLLATTTSTGDGIYTFGGLPAGDYFVDPVEATLPSGFGATVGSADASALILLSDGENYDRADFGYAPNGSSAIGDQIYVDDDGDGFPDTGELGIPNVDVTIAGPGGFNQTVTTGPDGYYLVTGVLVSGIYVVSVDTADLPAGLSTTPTAWPTAIQDFPVIAGEDMLYADFGFQPTGPGIAGSIGDTVFLDTDGNGALDVGEPGLGDVTVTLETSVGVFLASTLTDQNGFYQFVGVLAGNYVVRVTDTQGVLVGLNLSAGSNPTAAIPLAAGQDYDQADFGYAPSAGTGTVGDFVWHDANGDGDHDAGEDGVEYVSVQLWLDVDDDGVVEPGLDNLIRTSWTDRNGEYYFHGVPFGDYLVTLTDARSVMAGLVKTAGTPLANDNSQPDPFDATLDNGRAPSELRADFGFFTSATAYAISGIVWFDNDGDGVREPPLEVGIANANVLLFRDLDGDGILDPSDPVFGRALSGLAGAYSFPNLPDLSDWVVAVDTVGTFLDTARQTTQLSTPDPGIEPVEIAGANEPDHDFGFTKPPTQALVTSFEAFDVGGAVQLEWQTASEIGTLGFFLYRWDWSSRSWLAVENALVPAPPSAPRGAVYRYLDSEAPAGEPQSYLLVESELAGGERHHGPFQVTALEPPPHRLHSAIEVELLPVSDFDRERLEQFREAAANQGDPETLALRTSESTPRIAVRLLVTAEGVHYLSSATIASHLGMALAEVESLLVAGQLALSLGGEPVAWWTEGATDLYFFAEKPASLYSSSEVYRLAPGAGGVAGATSGGAPQPEPGDGFWSTEHFESNVFAATAGAQNPASDYWYWVALSGGSATMGTSSLDFVLPDVTASNESSLLELRLFGATSSLGSPDHQVEVRLNGVSIGSKSWDGSGERSVTLAFSTSLIQDGANTLEVTAGLPEDVRSSVVYVDAFAVTYPRRYRAQGDRLRLRPEGDAVVTIAGLSGPSVDVLDVTDPAAPIRVTDTTVDAGDGYRVSFVPAGVDREYFVAAASAARVAAAAPVFESDLLAASGWNYVVIAPDALLDAAQRLADYRAGMGLLPRLVSLQEVYDVFNHSRPSPLAIRDFFAHAYLAWPIRPEYGVLIGKGSFDYRDYQGTSTNLMPPLMVATPHGLYASDTALGDVVADLGAPEIAVGRIPVLTPQELDDYIDKLIAYDAAGSERGDGHVVLAADNSDQAGDFTTSSDAVAAELPEDFTTERIYLDAEVIHEARVTLFSSLEQGARLVNYIGHGGLDRFAAEGLMTVADVPDLDANGRLPVVASFTCAVSRFEVPGATSLGEALVLAQGRGAVAVVAPSGLSLNDAAHQLNREFVNALFNENTETVGQAFRRALQGYQALGSMAHTLRIYGLLGDPALPLLPMPIIDGGPVLFFDDFESGDLSAWSSTQP